MQMKFNKLIGKTVGIVTISIVALIVSAFALGGAQSGKKGEQLRQDPSQETKPGAPKRPDAPKLNEAQTNPVNSQ